MKEKAKSELIVKPELVVENKALNRELNLIWSWWVSQKRHGIKESEVFSLCALDPAALF